MPEDTKPTKKQLKSLNFRKSKETKEQAKKRPIDDTPKPTDAEEPVPKKRKTRRGKGGKGKNSKKGNRFLIFVGSIPKNTTESELQAHFKSCSPDQIRLRPDKGIAFLEFDAEKDHSTIQRRMDVALLQNKTLFKGNRINVELTVGGGGNSQNRLEKLKVKNEKMETERRDRLKNMIAAGKAKTAANVATNSASTAAPAAVHPDRAKLLQ
ncbi:HBR516Wp [Eremothecium sinecaudum]|uniref:HBR516Wp n=1 Tax=Eremothecium sinecaudum TaxID=45286 RepID=A0A109UYD9_9SACH|nr:HBR516Wp [Eremothecium sinecaudum]AMD19417.1 HBR516Wp [Eremothecium sinecaudum]